MNKQRHQIWIDLIRKLKQNNPEVDFAFGKENYIIYTNGNAEFILPDGFSYENNTLISAEGEEFLLDDSKNIGDTEILDDNGINVIIKLGNIEDKNSVEFTTSPEQTMQEAKPKAIKFTSKDYEEYKKNINFSHLLKDRRYETKRRDKIQEEYEEELYEFKNAVNSIKKGYQKGLFDYDRFNEKYNELVEMLAEKAAVMTVQDIKLAYYNKGIGEIKGLSLPASGSLMKRLRWHFLGGKKAAIDQAKKQFISNAKELIELDINNKEKTVDLFNGDDPASINLETPDVIAAAIIEGKEFSNKDELKKENPTPPSSNPNEETKKEMVKEAKMDYEYVRDVMVAMALYKEYQRTGNPKALTAKNKLDEAVYAYLSNKYPYYLKDGNFSFKADKANDFCLNPDMIPDVSEKIAEDLMKTAHENYVILNELKEMVENNGEVFRFNLDPNKPYELYHLDNEIASYVQMERARRSLPINYEKTNLDKWAKEARHGYSLNSLSKEIEERVNVELDYINSNEISENIEIEKAKIKGLRDSIAKLNYQSHLEGKSDKYNEEIFNKTNKLLDVYKDLDLLYEKRLNYNTYTHRQKDLAEELLKEQRASAEFFIKEGRAKEVLPEDKGRLHLTGYMDFNELVNLGHKYMLREVASLSQEEEKLKSQENQNKEKNKDRLDKINKELNRLTKISNIKNEIDYQKEAANKAYKEEQLRYKEEYKTLRKEQLINRKDELEAKNKLYQNAKNAKLYSSIKGPDYSKFHNAEDYKEQLVGDNILELAALEFASRARNGQIGEELSEKDNSLFKIVKNIKAQKDDLGKTVYSVNEGIDEELIKNSARDILREKYDISPEEMQMKKATMSENEANDFEKNYNRYHKLEQDAATIANAFYGTSRIKL